MKNNFDIVPFSEFKDKINRDSFDCGNSHLNDFIKTKASQYEKSNFAKIYLAKEENTNTIAGYYSLSAGSVELTNIPKEVAKKIPKHPKIPVALIGKLAVNKIYQGQGLGSFLLMDALDRIMKISSELGYFAVEVDAIDESAKNFYSKYGFESLLDDNKHMYITLKKLLKIQK
jgi:ribosomal protein S18 acetylase RimI-like enzyme